LHHHPRSTPFPYTTLFRSTRGHHADIGGSGAGGYNPEARTVWEEGLRITPSKLYCAGKYHRGLWTMILANVRLPSLVEGDLQAQDRKSTRLNSSHVKISYA